LLSAASFTAGREMPNYSFKRTAVAVRATIMRYAAAAA
jgi:hypothetical protein